MTFSERLAALYTKNFAPAARKLLVLGQSVEVHGKLSQGQLRSLENKGGILITGGILMNNWTDYNTFAEIAWFFPTHHNVMTSSLTSPVLVRSVNPQIICGILYMLCIWKNNVVTF